MPKNIPRTGKRLRPKTAVKGKRYLCAKCRKRSPRPVKTPAPWYCSCCLARLGSARADVAGTKQSDYEIAPVTDTAKLKSVLKQALGETVVVEKTRQVSLVGQSRVHLDAVEGLGSFLELEVVLQEGQSPAEGHAIARELMQQLGIQEADLIAAAYADMLMVRAVGASATSDPPPTRSSTPSTAGQSTESAG